MEKDDSGREKPVCFKKQMTIIPSKIPPRHLVFLITVCPGWWDADAGDDEVILSEARWRERQRRSFPRLSECASLSSAHSAQMMMGPWISTTLTFWPALDTVGGKIQIREKNSPAGQITSNENYLFLILRYALIWSFQWHFALELWAGQTRSACALPYTLFLLSYICKPNDIFSIWSDLCFCLIADLQCKG